MQIRELSTLSPDSIESLLRGIPFYKEIQQQDQEQFNIVLMQSKLVDLEPGDIIMRSGDRGSWLYFLLKGQLVVYPESGKSSSAPLNYIMPGELFGDLAMLSNCERRATVCADENCKQALLFATNFSPFGEIDDFSLINMATKLVLYRMMVHSIRWKLEVNKTESPDHELVNEMRSISIYTGDKGGIEELQALSDHAKKLAKLLIRWNASKSNPQDLFVASAKGTITKQILDDIA